MNTGYIKKKMEGKDFGFIAVEGGTKDFFFHRNEVTDPVGFDGLVGEDKDKGIKGDQVTFDTQEDSKGRGMNAVNVKKA
ncbi:MAG: cold shock domain-containing protein [Candidatus Pacebacteria bacterium]|nr:cold shock domain-containing protein [Candidatus Paceibacterota bacterium]